MADESTNFLMRHGGTLIITGATSLVAGGLGWVFRAVHLSRKLDADISSDLFQRLQARLGDLERQVTARDEQNARLMADRAQMSEDLLKARLALADRATPPVSILKAMIDRDVGLMWAERRVGKGEYPIVRVSSLVATLYIGGSVYECDGKPAAHVWPDDAALRMAEVNERVHLRQEGEFVTIPVSSPWTGISGEIRGRKYPVHLHDGDDYIITIAEHFDREPDGEGEPPIY